MTRFDSSHRRSSCAVVCLLALWSLGFGGGFAEEGALEPLDEQALLRLGQRLFDDARFAAPRGDFATSCASCHKSDEDPQGVRAHADFLALSWFPWRSEDPRRDQSRNAPTLLDAADYEVLHFDGEFRSLEALSRATLTGRPLGWLPGEQDEASEHLRSVLIADRAPDDDSGDRSYAELVRSAFGVELEQLAATEVVELAADALAGHLRTLRGEHDSPWDRWLVANRLPPAPEATESAQEYGRRLLSMVGARSRAGELEEVLGFGEQEIEGARIFFASEGERAGNCVACHVPPAFSDGRFHNLGVTQAHYDAVHGEGSFARYPVPSGEVDRPIEHLRRLPSARDPRLVDLGYWNFAEVADERSLAAFKTPTLRNLAYTQPYLHDGRYATVSETLTAIAAWAAAARAGTLRAPAPELAGVVLDYEGLSPLEAFLAALGEPLLGDAAPPPFRQPARDRDGNRRDNYPRW